MRSVDRNRDRALATGEVGLQRARCKRREVTQGQLLTRIDVMGGHEAPERARIGDRTNQKLLLRDLADCVLLAGRDLVPGSSLLDQVPRHEHRDRSIGRVDIRAVVLQVHDQHDRSEECGGPSD